MYTTINSTQLQEEETLKRLNNDVTRFFMINCKTKKEKQDVVVSNSAQRKLSVWGFGKVKKIYLDFVVVQSQKCCCVCPRKSALLFVDCPVLFCYPYFAISIYNIAFLYIHIVLLCMLMSN